MKKLLTGLGILLTLGFLAGITLVILANIYSLETLNTPENVANVQELDAFFENLTATNTLPSINVVVVKGDEIIYDKGYGTANGIIGFVIFANGTEIDREGILDMMSRLDW